MTIYYLRSLAWWVIFGMIFTRGIGTSLNRNHYSAIAMFVNNSLGSLRVGRYVDINIFHLFVMLYFKYIFI